MINRKYFPSKKFLIALSMSVVIIVIALIINYSNTNVTKYSNESLSSKASSVATPTAAIDVDSDNDGLPDWKEALYGTDPKKADTDGDGTSDFIEISLNRDPLKANTAPVGQEPNDKVDAAILENNQKIIDQYEKLNETDKFSRDLVSNIIASQPVNGSMSTDTMNSIISKSLEELPEKNYNGITNITDLNLLKTDSTSLNKNMTEYIKDYTAETNKLVPILGSDANIINTLIVNNDPNAKSEMLKLTDKYQAVVDYLVKMPVPVAVGYYDINYHFAVINDLEKLIAIDKDVVNSGVDSLGVFSSLSKYNDVINDLFTILATIDGVLKIQR